MVVMKRDRTVHTNYEGISSIMLRGGCVKDFIKGSSKFFVCAPP